MRLYLLACLLAVASALLALPSSAIATSFAYQPWQQIVGQADFAGVVECVAPGEIVAEFKVVESWFGPKAGTRITIRLYASVWEPVVPIALYRERYLVAASKDRAGHTLWPGLGTGPGGGVPIWWRDSTADYYVPTPMHSVKLDNPTRRCLACSDKATFFEHDDLAGLRADARALFSRGEEHREATILRGLINPTGRSRTRHAGADSAALASLRVYVTAAPLDSIVTALIEFGKRGGSLSEVRAYVTLCSGGRFRSLALFKKAAERGPVLSAQVDRNILNCLGARLGETLDPDYADRHGPPDPPSPADLPRLRLGLWTKWRGGDFTRAFETLSIYDCDSLTNFLAHTWANLEESPFDADAGHALGSYLSWKCEGDRARHLRTLCRARDPFVRVAGAIYLSFEEKEEGLRQLREMTYLDGDPGAWAALSLARWGDKSSVARALEVFRTGSGASVAGGFHRELQKRILILLSRSAQTSHISQPGLWSVDMFNADRCQAQIFQYYRDWWDRNQRRLSLRDDSLTLSVKSRVE